MHLLHPPAGSTTSQPRYFSSSARSPAGDSRDDASDPPIAGSKFGFQSLTGLFQPERPLQGRYSRPREERPELEAPPAQAQAPVAAPKDKLEKAAADRGFFRPTIAAHESQTPTAPVYSEAPDSASASSAPQKAGRPARTENAAAATDPSPKTRRARLGILGSDAPSDRTHVAKTGRPPNARQEAAFAYHSGRSGSSEAGTSRVADPFVGSSARGSGPGLRGVDGKRRAVQSARDSDSDAWGLSDEDSRTIESLADPSAFTPAAPTANAESAAPPAPARGSPSKRKAEVKAKPTPTLTHVTASGEAHMVDVGAKPATRRVAVATTYVRFSNPEPFRLIFENSNKKGDVLGVARIAGIMAAKRTADLIPLCHPIAISRVEVDVQLAPPGGGPLKSVQSQNKHGVVTLQAAVETVGPTGVEMEALTAVTAAALTVIDMCKAVDRAMEVRSTKVVYKSGGRSGVHANFEWLRDGTLGTAWLEERGLEMPRFVSSADGTIRTLVQ
ncbi:hypothetical protein LTR53_011149 [Teratosphaeriaceae sp. CCFEE 6253]|nr:hypothetical protein LTR53_011149 [Teratosphaeriaceae sp. CCFEE 6253]